MNKRKRTVRVSYVKMFLMLGVFLWWLAPTLPGAELGRTLMVRTNGALLAPTNFFNTNAHAVYRGLTNAGYAFGGGSGVGVYGTNGIIGTTQGTVVAFSLYSAPAIASFVNDKNSVEIGSTVTNTVLTWTLIGGAITSQSLNQSIGALAIGLRTYSHTNTYTTDRTYTLTASDGTTTPTANTTVTFKSKRYWGVLTNSTPTDAQIIAQSSELATAFDQTRTLSTTNSYPFFAWPATFGTVGSFKVGGFVDDGWTLTTRSFTNASNYASSYNIYVHTETLLGTWLIEVLP